MGSYLSFWKDPADSFIDDLDELTDEPCYDIGDMSVNLINPNRIYHCPYCFESFDIFKLSKHAKKHMGRYIDDIYKPR